MASSDSREACASPSLGFTDLPGEVQREIIRHCSRNDLICLSLVSKHVRELAAAELYRDFHIVFPDEDNPQFDTPVDPLAGGFHTFVTSEYNYAQHLRSLCFDTFYMGGKAEIAYRPYSANLSCGKFMNTLLLLTLRKARGLESFKWNIRVELSRSVYKELHQINALSHVHIRLQAGPSQYETPPPLPYSGVSNSNPSSVPAHIAPVASLAPPTGFGAPPPPSLGLFGTPANAPLPPLPKPPRSKSSKKTSSAMEPATLSGFKRLKTLAVLDIESLDIVPQLQSCVHNSAGTLSKLKLSFSEKLASLSRKPSADPDPEDTDADDDFQPLPVAPAQNDDGSLPARVFRAQEEKKIQEAVLGTIFGVEPHPDKKAQSTTRDKKDKEAKTEPRARTNEVSIRLLKTFNDTFMRELNGTHDVAPSPEVLDMIGLAAQKYIDEAKLRKGEGQANPSGASSSSSSQLPGDATAAGSGEASGSTLNLFGTATASTKGKEVQKDMEPDDINIEEPEEQLAIDSQDPSVDDTPVNEPANTPLEGSLSPAASPGNGKADFRKALDNLMAQKANYKALAEQLAMFESQAKSLDYQIEQFRANNPSVDLKTLVEAEARLLVLNRNIQKMQEEIAICEAEVDRAEKNMPEDLGSNKLQAHARHMREYLRETRGIALESLSIYLIPVKASVLSKAVDLRVLRRLTLLNVGVQAPIWALLHKENKEAPLPLRKIFTDNVSPIFLTFVAGLEELHELFLLEREAKAKPESFAPKTQTTIDEIRKRVLRRHMPTLQRLMIKNLADTAWDVNEKTILLMCRQGRKLEELACSMGIRSMHILMQNVAGLANLRALHVVQLRNDDTCVWVMRETKRFLIDNVSHHPALKLEWVSIDDDDRVDRLVRRVVERKSPKDDDDDGSSSSSEEKKKKEEKAKGKGKQKAGLLSMLNMDLSAALATAELCEGFSESEDDDGDGDVGMKVETVDDLHFCDVPGVRIFKKEVVAGRL
ncbi:hypothetical protein VTK56DRAFT_3218 [Thermocarpiscus australiensis]